MFIMNGQETSANGNYKKETNGNIISLPFKIKVMKEYDYITIGIIKKKEIVGENNVEIVWLF